MQEFAFMVFCFGFFIFVVKMVTTSADVDYHRRVNEIREFGHELPESPTSRKSTRKK